MKRIVFLLSIFNLAIIHQTKAQDFFTQSILNNLNDYPNGFSAYAQQVSTNMPTLYGSVLGFRFWDGGGSDWRTQLAFGTDNNFYYRQSTNTAGTLWSGWLKVYHSGNMNASNIDFTAQMIKCASMNIQGGTPQSITDILHVGSGNSWGGNGAAITLGGGNIKSARIMGYTYDGNDHRGSLYLQTKKADGNWFNGLVIVHSTGYVGIGTDSPGYQLDVLGTIRAKEIKVDLNGADFVFENNYKLMPLNELELFVKEHKHLPEIAPATEMEKDGTDLGNLNSKLLQKIEELTLYTIELNNKLERQNQENQELKKKIEKINVLEEKIERLEFMSK